MAQPLLHLSNIGLVVECVGGGRCAQRMNAEAFNLRSKARRATVFADNVVIDGIGIERAVERAGAVVRNRTEHMV